MAYKLAAFEILRDFERFFCISIYYASTLSLHIESTDSVLYTYVCVCVAIVTLRNAITI